VRHKLASLAGVAGRTIRRHRMIAAGDRVLIAVSGGPDSTGLALVLDALRSRLRCALVVAHVHHGLRGSDADGDEVAASTVASRLGLPFVRSRLSLPSGGNVEARARTARYAALHDLAVGAGCNRIATGHTRDDQAETFLLRLLRGAGAEGLSGIQPVRADGVIRPILECQRADIAAVIAEYGFEVRVDAMNTDPRFLRSRVRHELLPLMERLSPDIVSLCARSADSLRGAAAAQEAWASRRLGGSAGGGALERTALADLDPDLRGVLLRSWLRRALPEARLTARLLAAVERLAVGDGPGRTLHITPGWRVERVGEWLRIAPAAVECRLRETGVAAPRRGSRTR